MFVCLSRVWKNQTWPPTSDRILCSVPPSFILLVMSYNKGVKFSRANVVSEQIKRSTRNFEAKEKYFPHQSMQITGIYYIKCAAAVQMCHFCWPKKTFWWKRGEIVQENLVPDINGLYFLHSSCPNMVWWWFSVYLIGIPIKPSSI